MIKWINVKNCINNFGQHTWFGTLCSMSTFTIYLKKSILFLIEEVFDWPMQVSPKWFLRWCCLYKLLVTWWSDNVIHFIWSLKLLIIIINSNICNWILIIFWIVCRLFFNGVRRFLMHSISGSRKHSVSGR